MLNGLIIGKFMPLTKGHIGLIDFGIENCDRLIVAVCTLKSEPIEGSLRYNWVKKYYENNKKVEVVHITKELPSPSKDMKELAKLSIKKQFQLIAANSWQRTHHLTIFVICALRNLRTVGAKMTS